MNIFGQCPLEGMFAKTKKNLNLTKDVKTQTELIKANYLSIFFQSGLQG